MDLTRRWKSWSRHPVPRRPPPRRPDVVAAERAAREEAEAALEAERREQAALDAEAAAVEAELRKLRAGFPGFGFPASSFGRPAVPQEVRARAPARAIVNLAAIRNNTELLQRAAADLGSQVMAVLKADAYGHGAVRVAHAMAECGVNAFAVATVVEAVELRCGGIADAKILVLGAPMPGDVPLLMRYSLDCMVSSYDVAARIARVTSEAGDPRPGDTSTAGRLGVHLYIETGMTRLGVLPDEVPRVLDVLHSAVLEGRIALSGLCTHFAEADDPASDYVADQLKRFDVAVAAVHAHPLALRNAADIPVHISNSAALLDARFHEVLRQYGSSYVRPGCALYGLYPEVCHRRGEHELGEKVAEGPRRVWVKELAIHSAMDGQLEEAMTFVAAVANVMEVPAGTTVGKCSSFLRLLSKSKEAAGTGYSRTTTTEERCLIATLGVGYADGYPRAASRKAQVRAAPFSPLQHHLS